MPVEPSTLRTRLRHLPAQGLLGGIWLYQHTLSPVLPAVFGPACGCRFQPTCSRYAAEALRRHGALAGLWLTLRRLSKCTPLHPGGDDPVPLTHRFSRASRLPLARNSRSNQSRPACTRV